MTSDFTKWMNRSIKETANELNRQAENNQEEEEEELIEEYPCRVCGEFTEVYEPEYFDHDMHYYGRSPSCCP